MSREIKHLTKEGGWITEKVTSTDLQTSALMRIADASEEMAASSKLMAQNYVRLQSDLKYYQEHYAARGQRIADLEKSNSALRGVITRMKNKESKQ